jgi:hypothetical protein
VCAALIVGISLYPQLRRLNAAPQSDRAVENQNDRDDPCDHLPQPLGKANGIAKKCPPGGSSSGVAKGDFNGDGYADLAIGEPDAMIGGLASAGDVIVVYGSASGLTNTGKQLWYESRMGTSSNAGDMFGSALAPAISTATAIPTLRLAFRTKTSSSQAASGVRHSNRREKCE